MRSSHFENSFRVHLGLKFDCEDDEMRRVQFSNVLTVGYDKRESVTARDDDNDVTETAMEKPRNNSRFETMSIEMEASDQDSSENSDVDASFVPTHKSDRRQSLASQIFTSTAKWAQQKDYRQRKMSLHGKPIYFTAPSRRKNKVRKFMILTFNFLERPGGTNLSILYHVSTFLLVCCSLVLTVFVTIPQHKIESERVLFVLEIILVTVFTVELLARVWSSGCRIRYQGFKGRIRFARKPFCIIDVIVVISSLTILVVGNQDHTFAATAMRGLRFLQILRMVRVDRRGGTWKLLGSVVYAHSKELITAWYIGFLALIFASFLVYQAEKEINEKEFATFADALWWGLITLTTIGYGDKAPKTWVGKLIACCFAILGISFFALPAGILGSGFALKVQEQHRRKHFARRRNPAAYLIQCFWRCYAADVDSSSTATWRPCLRAYIAYHQPTKKPSIRGKILGSTTSPRLKLPRELEKGRVNFLSNDDFGKDDIVKTTFEKLQEKFTSLPSRSGSLKSKMSTEKKFSFEPEMESITDDDSSTKSSKEIITDLTEKERNAIRGFRMMKFYVARRKFKEALRPYDVKDVIEQYSSGHIDMLARVKNLQNRVDCIVGLKEQSSPLCNRVNSTKYRSKEASSNGRTTSNNTDPYVKNLSMHERLIKVENSVNGIERKIDSLLVAFKRQDRRFQHRKPIFKDLISSDSDESSIHSDDATSKRKKFKIPFSSVNLTSPGLKKRRISEINDPVDGKDDDDVFVEDSNDNNCSTNENCEETACSNINTDEEPPTTAEENRNTGVRLLPTGVEKSDCSINPPAYQISNGFMQTSLL